MKALPPSRPKVKPTPAVKTLGGGGSDQKSDPSGNGMSIGLHMGKVPPGLLAMAQRAAAGGMQGFGATMGMNMGLPPVSPEKASESKGEGGGIIPKPMPAMPFPMMPGMMPGMMMSPQMMGAQAKMLAGMPGVGTMPGMPAMSTMRMMGGMAMPMGGMPMMTGQMVPVPTRGPPPANATTINPAVAAVMPRPTVLPIPGAINTGNAVLGVPGLSDGDLGPQKNRHRIEDIDATLYVREGRAGIHIDHTPEGCVITKITSDQPKLHVKDMITHINNVSLQNMDAEAQTANFCEQIAGRTDVTVQIKRPNEEEELRQADQMLAEFLDENFELLPETCSGWLSSKAWPRYKEFRVNCLNGLHFCRLPIVDTKIHTALVPNGSVVLVRQIKGGWVQCHNHLWMPILLDSVEVLIRVEKMKKEMTCKWDDKMKAGFQTIGATITTVFPHTPAWKAGMHHCKGWKIARVNDTIVMSDDGVVEALKKTREPGKEFTIVCEGAEPFSVGTHVDISLLQNGQNTGKFIPGAVANIKTDGKYGVKILKNEIAEKKKWVGQIFSIDPANMRYAQPAGCFAVPMRPTTRPDAQIADMAAVAATTVGQSSDVVMMGMGDDDTNSANYIKDKYAMACCFTCRHCQRTLPQYVFSKPQQKMAKRIKNHNPICLACNMNNPMELEAANKHLLKFWGKEFDCRYQRCTVTGYPVLIADNDEYKSSKKYEESYNEAMPQARTVDEFVKAMMDKKYYAYEFRIFPFCMFSPVAHESDRSVTLRVSQLQEYCDVNGNERLVGILQRIFERVDTPFEFVPLELNQYVASSLKLWTRLRFLARKYCSDYTKRNFIDALWDMETKKTVLQKNQTKRSLVQLGIEKKLRILIMEYAHFMRVERPYPPRSGGSKRSRRSRSRSGAGSPPRKRRRDTELERRLREIRAARGATRFPPSRRRRGGPVPRPRRSRSRSRSRRRHRRSRSRSRRKRRRSRSRSRSRSRTPKAKKKKKKKKQKKVKQVRERSPSQSESVSVEEDNDKSKSESVSVEEDTSSDSVQAAPGEPVKSADLPPPWTMVYSATKQRWYYYNEETGDSKWELPEEVAIYRAKHNLRGV